jgi:TPR repeat protein
MRFIFTLGVTLVLLTDILVAADASMKEARTAYRKKDYKQAFQLYMTLAEQGNVKAMVEVAQMYYIARGVKHDASQALRWYQAAARGGSAKAAFRAALMFYDGHGTEQDYKAAADFFRQAAEKGHLRAHALLGSMYYEGRGMAKDMEQAAFWFRLGSEKGGHSAQQWLMKMKTEGYLAPDGTFVSKPEASADDKPVSSVVKVSGGVRQTVSAVDTGPPPVEAVQNVEQSREAEEDLSRTEYWAMAIAGLVMLLIAPLAFFFPEAFMYGRRSFFWRELLGEQATAVMIRVISIIIGVIGILFMFTGIYSNLKS